MPSATDRPLRIVLADMPALLADLLATVLSDDPGLELVGRVQSDPDLERAIAPLDADFVLIGLDSVGGEETATQFLEQRRHPQLVGIDTRNGRAAVHRLRREQKRMLEISLPMLPAMLRDCWASGGEPI